MLQSEVGRNVDLSSLATAGLHPGLGAYLKMLLSYFFVSRSSIFRPQSATTCCALPGPTGPRKMERETSLVSALYLLFQQLIFFPLFLSQIPIFLGHPLTSYLPSPRNLPETWVWSVTSLTRAGRLPCN